MEEHEQSKPNTGEVPLDPSGEQGLQGASSEAVAKLKADSEDAPDTARRVRRVSRVESAPRRARRVLSTPPSGSVDAVWTDYFERCEARIDKAESDRYAELRKIRRRKGVIFIAYCGMAALAIINLAIAITLALLNATHSGSSDAELMHKLIVSGGGLVGTSGITGALALARRGLRSDEQALAVQGREISRIQAVMVAARVATDEQRRCEFLGDMTRSLNALLREEAPETGGRARKRRRRE
jgi:hypothetical protein